MVKQLSRRFFIGTALGALSTGAWAEAPSVSLRPVVRPKGLQTGAAPKADALIKTASLGGQVEFAVMDVKTGVLLESRGAAAGLPPASVIKTVTALYALDSLGADYRFATRLIATGPLEDGVLKGDLVLAGGGDPTLDTNALAQMASDLKEAGVREVRGAFKVWGGAVPYERVIDPTQPEHVSYNPSVSGLNLNFNRVHFEWKRGGDGYDVSMDARSDRYRPAVTVARMVVAGRKAPVYTYSDGGDHDAWTVARGALGASGSRWLPVRKPEAYAAEVFAGFARAHGITLNLGGSLRSAPQGLALTTHQSGPLRDILRNMLKYSNNLTAELVGLTATAARGGKAVALATSAKEMSRWARSELGMQGANLVDHSGLSEQSRLNAGAMARALVRVHGDKQLQPILKDIPLRNSAGGINRDHPVKVMAKTGTLYFVSSLAGYMTAPDGTELAFAIFCANTEKRAGINRRAGGRPPGAANWNRRAKSLQQALIERWGLVYGV
ncbi:D-alanyl-D-alanine carboxypeptidase/D-alanyl-D-alanine-endopeptidase [Roseovarius gahaiensis]|uniref:D-alanyl-D-alanine carboxypeptidase/D-alanyl-D-alanine-endopeptidase n=1 Tax=Roseovarius gahaiensis TaxID=2716691 RepID=A0A967BD43_9RHOB|nr:D-alanyl-D-alanine carboxypeptidase/D-alanyl-D-alanine-endopeptidase [Roseovarius gahaiensis]NHQ74320.1 D-alanyl-D-alanine carboxypeptidase/D-alanyl-D-alanine-endopeptidase [Roseovarius gahaiensis]